MAMRSAPVKENAMSGRRRRNAPKRINRDAARRRRYALVTVLSAFMAAIVALLCGFPRASVTLACLAAPKVAITFLNRRRS
jgi:hypothetical protein